MKQSKEMAPQQQQPPQQKLLVADEERILQAIVLGDSFNERFMPVTLDKPRCLLPLLNVPLIEYTLEFLAMSGIQEVVLFCRSHADQLRAYVAQSRWCRPTSTLTVQIVVNSECSGVGDALRDIDGRQLIRGDFVLCYGDIVANVNLWRILGTFREHRQRDKSLIMTMVTKRALPSHRTREHGELAVFGLVPHRHNELKLYVPLDHHHHHHHHHPQQQQQQNEDNFRGENTARQGRMNRKTVSIPVELLRESEELELRYDLLDCNIDICSPEVLASFTENFDYQDVRRDFVRGVLSNWELLGQRLNVHVLEMEYAARVRNSALYDAVSRDVLARWVFPIVTDASILDGDRVHFAGDASYVGEQVLLARTAHVGPGCLLGTGTTVGPNARLRGCVIGRGVQIGAECVITDCYLWDGVIVEAGCQLTACIVSDRVRIKTGSSIAPGCLVTSEVTIGPKAVLPRNCRVAKLSDRMDQAMQALGLGSLEQLSAAATHPHQVLGKDSDGVLWDIDDVTDNPIFTIGLCHDLIHMEDAHYYGDRCDAYNGEDDEYGIDGEYGIDDDDNDSVEDEDGDHGSPRAPMKTRREREEAMTLKARKDFAQEAADTLLNAMAQEYAVDNALLELNALKFACNASFADCREAILQALLTASKGSPDLAVALTRTWAPLLARFVAGDADERHLMQAMDRLPIPAAVPLSFMVPILYDCDVLSGEAILAWHAQPNGQSPLRQRLVAFCDFLLQSDDDEDDDENGGDNGENGDEEDNEGEV